MKKIFFVATLWIGFLVTSQSVFAQLVSQNGDVFFVANYKELNTALQQKSALRGIAVSSAFYSGLTDDKKKEVSELVQYVKDAHYRPIFIYGQPVDILLAKKLLILNRNNNGCKPPIFIGILPTKNKDNSESVINMCAADNKERSEKWLRSSISNYWKETKETVKKWGSAVLD